MSTLALGRLKVGTCNPDLETQHVLGALLWTKSLSPGRPNLFFQHSYSSIRANSAHTSDSLCALLVTNVRGTSAELMVDLEVCVLCRNRRFAIGDSSLDGSSRSYDLVLPSGSGLAWIVCTA